MKRWELWEPEDDSEGRVFLSEDHEEARSQAIAEGLELRWVCSAAGWNSAHQLLYDHLGWGEYKPMMGPDGSPYP
jgi:hypothetical protein